MSDEMRGNELVPGAVIPPRRDEAPASPPVASGRGYTWRTFRGREYTLESHWRCRDCDAHLEDEDAVELHDLWHALPENKRFAQPGSDLG